MARRCRECPAKETPGSGAGDGLQRDDNNFSRPKASASGFKTSTRPRSSHSDGDNEAGTVAAIFLLNRNGVEVSRVDFRN